MDISIKKGDFKRMGVCTEKDCVTITFETHTDDPVSVLLYKKTGYKLIKEIEIEKKDEGPVRINVEEVKKPELNAKLVAENIGFQLGKRMNFRRAVKMALQSTMNAGAKGVRIEVAGRLNGAEMSRREKFIEGSVPLHTLRADIDFYCHHAPTIAGIVGVKVWIYKGEK